MELSIAWLGPPVEVVLLAGLILRGRVPQARALAVLVVAFLATDALILGYPTYNTWAFWTAKESIHIALFAWVGVETTTRGSDNAAVRRAVLRWTTFVTAAAVLLVLAAPATSPVVEILPRLMGALAWLYTGLVVIMLRHDARVTALQDAVLTGFTPYLIIYAVTWNQAALDTSAANLVNPAILVIVLVVIARAAWARDIQRDRQWLRRERAAAATPNQRATRNHRTSAHALKQMRQMSA